MTTIYFIRHASVDHTVHNDLTRPLTKQGNEDAVNLVHHFKNIDIDYIYSSPYLRAIDTLNM